MDDWALAKTMARSIANRPNRRRHQTHFGPAVSHMVFAKGRQRNKLVVLASMPVGPSAPENLRRGRYSRSGQAQIN